MFERDELFYEKLESNGWGRWENTGYHYMEVTIEEDDEDEYDEEGDE